MSQNVPPNAKDTCACLKGYFSSENLKYMLISGDTVEGEVELLTCKICARQWISIEYQPKVYEDDDRWFRGLIDPDAVPAISQGNSMQNALAYLASLDWYYTSGTYWVNVGVEVPFKRSGEIMLWP